MQSLINVAVFSPLVAAIIAGFFGKLIGRNNAHRITIAGVALTTAISLYLLYLFSFHHLAPFSFTLYQWGFAGDLVFQVGFLIDSLTVLMMCVVSFVSLMVHVYTIGYMQDDPGYQRFFSYIAFFTFSMLMLVTSHNFMQLFFGWEAVGVASYLLIGFWFKKDSAIFANMKAFLVNRIGDFGFLLGIGVIYYFVGRLDYASVFAKASLLAQAQWSLSASLSVNAATLACLCLFVGAMGKSAQIPLHVWLPDSMEGPTPISALIHAATMVTAGVFMVARLSSLYELSEVARSFILIIGSLTCLLMGLIGLVQNDIKRVIAYSTLSQLGYMMLALGASHYAAGIFHLMTHAFFKALLFLGAGSVIIGMHHEQDIRKMGGLAKKMPITYITFWIGSLALAGIPPFAGFFSKDAIIESLANVSITGGSLAYYCATIGVLITSLYSFRLLFLVFHTQPRMDDHTLSHVHESPKVVWLPLVLLAIPSVLIGGVTVHSVLSPEGFLGGALINAHHAHGPMAMLAESFFHPPLYLASLGLLISWWLYQKQPQLPAKIEAACKPLPWILKQKYGFDWFNEHVVAKMVRVCGDKLWQQGDMRVIDGMIVNGSARSIGRLAKLLRHLQTGALNHYVFSMLTGIVLLLGWMLWN